MRKRTLTGIIMMGVGVPCLAWAAGDSLSEVSMTHRMMMLVIQLGVILFLARLGNMLFEKIRLPGVIGELVAGMIIGPYLLGGISLPAFPSGLFPSAGAFPISPELYGICALASVVLLFMVGLETDVGLFMRYSVAGSVVGMGGVTISFLLGDLLAVLFSPMLFGQQMGFMSAPCLLLGVISTATSVGISARILSEQRKTDSPEGVTILAGAVVDDILGIVLLAVVLGVISATRESGSINWIQIGIIAAKAVGVWLTATVIGLLASSRISLLLKWFRDRSSIATMALGLALILAGLFEEAGLAMIVGAYVMGLSLSRTDINQVIRERLRPIYAFLVPVFFAVMGMMVDFRLLLSQRILFFGLAYTLGAALAKIVGCGVPALFCNFNLRGALRIGCGMLPRGEVTLIIAGIGLSAGVLNAEVFGVVVLMLLVASLIGPPLLVGLFKNPASGLRKAVPSDEIALLSFNFPSAQTAELLVLKLLGVFESEGFFVHALSRRDRLYQLRKDTMVIALRQEDDKIVFECHTDQTTLVNTAMYEVLAELEQTVRELRKPVDRQAIGKKLQEQSGEFSRGRVITDHLTPSCLEPNLKARNKNEVLEELLGILDGHHAIQNMDAARRAVLDREESMSTGMQYGIAIPHGRTDAVARLVCAVGISRTGIDFDSIDGRPSRIFVLTLSPKSATAPQVQFMSAISQVLDEEGRAALLVSDTPADMYAVLAGMTHSGHGMRRQDGVTLLAGKKRDASTDMTHFLRKDLMKVDLAGTTKMQVIEELLDLVDRQGLVRDVDLVRAEILEREEDMPTGMDHGIAIPHARTEEVQDLICAVGISKKGVDFGLPDVPLSNIIALTLSPQDAPVPHLRFMAMLSRTLDAKGRKSLLACRTPDDMYAILTGN